MSTNTERERPFTIHSSTIILYLILISIVSLFLAFSGAYLFTLYDTDALPVNVPVLFVFNTLLLLGSSFTLNLAKKCYKKDNTSGYINSLMYTIFLSIGFIFAQFAAWKVLVENNINLTSSTTASYLYIISFLHMLHVVGGLIFLFLFWWSAKKNMKEPVTVFIYFSDPEKKEKLRLLYVYWNFLDILWIYLILFFYLNYILY